MARINALVNRCRLRGGDCPCFLDCQAICVIDEKLGQLELKRRDIERAVLHLQNERSRLTSPPARVKVGFKFDGRYEPAVVFSENNAEFGYISKTGAWISSDQWPFDRETVWPDDCERLQIRVELSKWFNSCFLAPIPDQLSPQPPESCCNPAFE